MKSIRYCLFAGLILMLLCGPVAAAEVRISVAASLTDAVKEVIAVYQQSHPEVQVLANFASSGALAKQISAGAPADLFISANPKWMGFLLEQGLMVGESEKILVHNSLVFTGHARDDVHGLEDLAQLTRIALGSPASVPAGQYAEQAMQAAGIYADLEAGNKLVLAKDVRQALLYADRGEVDGAFVYRTDALLAQDAQILFSVPQEFYPQVTYPAALTKSAAENAAAAAFFSYLFSPEARSVLVRYGFLIAE
ncbi:MAG: molybdate ABC transporter substrate-binding protein [Desulfuromonas sp.]|nr:MAG: molybdate ABC transporter substrate-binding protein [Desulfuromonas sp.]